MTCGKRPGFCICKRKPHSLQRRVTPQPDQDFESLKACCNALEACSSPRMVKATLDFLNSKYGRPGAV